MMISACITAIRSMLHAGGHLHLPAAGIERAEQEAGEQHADRVRFGPAAPPRWR